MQRTIVAAKIRPPARKPGMKSKKLNTDLLKSELKATELRNSLTAKLGTTVNQLTANAATPPDVTVEWASLSKTLHETSIETLGFMKKRHQD